MKGSVIIYLNWFVAAGVFLGCSLSSVLEARLPKSTYARAERVHSVENMLSTLNNTDPKILHDTQRYLDAIERNDCQSAYHRLRVDCMIQAARRHCLGMRSGEKRKQCLLYSDILVVNKLSENHFISVAERYQIMNEQVQYRPTLRRKLSEHYGALTMAFLLAESLNCSTTDQNCLATQIDRFCLHETDSHNLSWQYCVAALTWFIGTAWHTY